MLSDDSTSDSDSGIRFKTDSTRREEQAANRNRGRGGRRNFSPERRRDNFQSGNRGRNDRRPFHTSRRSPLRDRGRSPLRDRQRSPIRERQRSPVRERERPRSPIKERERTPVRERPRSPIKERERTPVRERPRSPIKEKERSLVREKPRSPVKERERSPVRERPRSPVKERDKSPFRDKGRCDRFSRDDRKPRDSDHHRQHRSHSNDRDRNVRDRLNDNIRASGDVARNGSRGDINHSSRSQAQKNDDSKGKRDNQKLYDRSQRFSEKNNEATDAELKRKEESRKRLEEREDRSRSSHLDIKDRQKRDENERHEGSSNVRSSSTKQLSEKVDNVKDRSLTRQHSSSGEHNRSKPHECRGKIRKEASVDKERERSAKVRTKSPIVFSKSSSKNESSKRETERITRPEKAEKASTETRKESVPLKGDNIKKATRKSPSLEVEAEDLNQDGSDVETKPVSYYNMISAVPNEGIAKVTALNPSDEPIAVSDSSGDEADLRKKLLLLEKELKKTKVKRKSKHKDKKTKKSHKKSKSSSKDSDSERSSTVVKIHSLPDESMSMKVTIRSDTAIESDKRIVSQANSDSKSHPTKLEISDDEEGEIFSDDGEGIDMSDLRLRLGRQIGPALPTIAAAKSKSSADLRDRLSRTAMEAVSGPALPPHMRPGRGDEMIMEVEGPALPPHLVKGVTKESASKTMGPSLPAEMRDKLTKTSKKDVTINVDSDAEHEDASNDEIDTDIVGPLPPGSENLLKSSTHRKLEERALKMKIGSLEGYDDKEVLADRREEWMLELPDVKAANLGLGPRQFRARAGPDLSDRTSWTDTPELKALKAAGVPVVTKESAIRDIQREAEAEFIQQRDAEQELAVKKHKKKSKRDESLVEIHQKKLEKKKKKERDEDGGSKRRPFDRDIDLKANKFDEAQKKSIMKKAQLLDTRFSSGESKFL